MTEYTNAIALASRLIIKKGRSVTLRRINEAANPEPWKPGAPTNDNHVIKAVFLGSQFFNRDGELVKGENENVLIAASGLAIVPTTADIIIDGSETLKIKNVEPLKPGDENILYTLEVER